MEDDAGEQPFLPLDTLLEVSVVEGNEKLSAFTEEASTKPPNQEVASESAQQDAAWSAAQVAWGMDPEEDAFYNDLFKDVSSVRYLRLHCTVCDVHLGCAPGTMLMRHVRLGTLLCKDCFQFYGTGEFTASYDGSESFCCWCGQGGSVFCCSNCPAVFCKKCIKLNYTRTVFKEILESSEWLCLVCNYRSLWEHRAVCRAAITYEASNYSPLQEGGENENGPFSDSPSECCAPDANQRRPRLKSGMPSEVTFGNLIKSGVVKASVSKMLRESARRRELNGGTFADSNETDNQQKAAPSVSENVSVVVSSTVQERVSQSSTIGMGTYSGTTHMAHKIVKISDSGTINGSPGLSVIQKPGMRDQTEMPRTTNLRDIAPTSESIPVNPVSHVVNSGTRVFNSARRLNIVCNNKLIQNGKVVIMPPLHLPAQSLHLPAQSMGTMTGSGTPQKTLVAMPLIATQGTPMFQLFDQNLVAVSNSGRTTNFPIVVNSSTASYIPTVANNTGGLLSAPTLSNVTFTAPINSVAANQEHHKTYNNNNNNLMGPPRLISIQQKKTNSNFSPSNNSVTHCPNNGQTSKTMPSSVSACIRPNSRENDNYSASSVSSSGLIRVRSPSALQSVGVSDIQHTVPALNTARGNSVGTKHSSEIAAPASCVKPDRPRLLDPSLLNSLQNTSRQPKDNSFSRSLGFSANSMSSYLKLNDGKQHSPIPQLVRRLNSHSLLRLRLTDQSCSNTVLSSSSTTRGDVSQEADIVNSINDSVSESSAGKSGDVDRNDFRKNLLEGENLAKYMLTRITCLQEEFDNKANQKFTFDDMVSHFSKLLEIARAKLNKVSKNFSTNQQKWRKCSSKSFESCAEAVCTISSGESDVDVDTNLQSNIEIEAQFVSAPRFQKTSVKESNEETHETSSHMKLRTYRQPSLKKLSALEISTDILQGKLSKTSDQHTKKVASINRNRTAAKRSTINRGKNKSGSRLIPDHSKRNFEVEIKNEERHENANSSCDTSETVSVNEDDFEIPEKRRKMKEVRIVLERIETEGTVRIKKEPKESDKNKEIVDSHEIIGNSVVNDTKLVNSIGKLTKPCSVVLHRLNVENFTHSI